MVGITTSDDAGVFRLDDDRALVQSVDFFAPIVDEAYDWGRIAAANALSDIYAMGGRPLTALQLVGWPRSRLPLEVLSEVIAGGADVMAGAGVTITGGHSIDNETPVYGFAGNRNHVAGRSRYQRHCPTGRVDSADQTPRNGYRCCRPQGPGGRFRPTRRGGGDHGGSQRAGLYGDGGGRCSCATDVTGYGLAGHLREVMTASGVSARLDMDAVPVLAGIADLVESGVYPGGSRRNWSPCDLPS